MRPQLEAGARELGLTLGETQMQQLLDYLTLIQKWNKVYNLTAVRDPQAMLTHHLLDSLAVVSPLRRRLAAVHPEIQAPSLLDVGTGAGLPGVVIAIACPDVGVTCVDTVTKKATFIQQAALTLGLTNLRGVHARVEEMAGQFDVVTSRAFASLADFVSLSRDRLVPRGVWMAMKARTVEEERSGLPTVVEVFHVEPLTVPGLLEDRCLVWLRPKTNPQTVLSVDDRAQSNPA